jgi:hypothetical protein
MVGVGWVCIGFKYEADIRTLKVIEHFQQRVNRRLVRVDTPP